MSSSCYLDKADHLETSGGYGTNGANGGKAGNVLISVDEDDMDLLLPVYWDIRGGMGEGEETVVHGMLQYLETGHAT